MMKLAEALEEVDSKMEDVVVTSTKLPMVGDGLAKFADIATKRFNSLEDSAKKFAGTFTDSLVDMVTKSEVSFAQILQGFLIMLAKMAARAAASRVVSGLFSSAAANPGGSASKAVGLIGGVGKVLGFADGGVVPGPKGAPVPAVVHGGETITPPGEGGGAGVVQNINISPGLPETVRAEISQFMPAIRQAAVEAVEGARRRGGSMASAMGAKA
jgi:phage-related minor tail protein